MQPFDDEFALGLEEIFGHGNLAALHPQPQNLVGGREHPRGGTRIPAPAAAPAMAVTIVNIRGLLSGYETIGGERLGAGLAEG